MRISSRISTLAVLATVINLFAALYFLVTTGDDRLAAMQLHLVAEIEFLVLVSWLLAKLLHLNQKPATAGGPSWPAVNPLPTGERSPVGRFPSYIQGNAMFQKLLEIEVGLAPWDEECAQVGSDDYAKRSPMECAVYIRQLGRIFGVHAPEVLSFVRRSFPHDFGRYHEVVACMNVAGHALFDESRLPAQWDHVARAELAWLCLSDRYRSLLRDGECELQDVPALYSLVSIPDFPDHPIAHWLALGIVPMPTGPALAFH